MKLRRKTETPKSKQLSQAEVNLACKATRPADLFESMKNRLTPFSKSKVPKKKLPGKTATWG